MCTWALVQCHSDIEVYVSQAPRSALFKLGTKKWFWEAKMTDMILTAAAAVCFSPYKCGARTTYQKRLRYGNGSLTGMCPVNNEERPHIIC